MPESVTPWSTRSAGGESETALDQQFALQASGSRLTEEFTGASNAETIQTLHDTWAGA